MKGATGMIKKPYAILNLETGKRLSICFKEKKHAKQHLKFIKSINDKYKKNHKVIKRTGANE